MVVFRPGATASFNLESGCLSAGHEVGARWRSGHVQFAAHSVPVIYYQWME